MKRLPIPYILFFVFFGFAIILWAAGTQNADIRSRADDLEATPTATPSATPTSTLTPTLTPTPTNSPPRCSGISVSPGAGAKPLTVNFACAGYDPDNDITAAEFGFGGDQKRLVEKQVGQFGAITTTYTYTKSGTYNVTCRLRDNNQMFSTYPDYCKYTVVVTDNALTPTPRRTPTPTKTIQDEDFPMIFTGGTLPSPTALPTIASATPTLALRETGDRGWWSSDKIIQLTMMVIVSGVTIIIALLLYGFFDKR